MVAFVENFEFAETALRGRAQRHRSTFRGVRCLNSNRQANLRSATYDGRCRLESCSKDPIRYQSAFDLFEFVHSNPGRFVDPSGLDTTIPEHPGSLPCKKRKELDSPSCGMHAPCTWKELQEWIRWRNCYGRPWPWQSEPFGIEITEAGCFGITYSLCGKALSFNDGDFDNCYEELSQAISAKARLEKDGICDGKTGPCNRKSRAVIFGFTWNCAKSLKDKPVKKPLGVCGGCGHVQWNDQRPDHCWIYDYGFYLENFDMICHATSADGYPEFSTCTGYEIYEKIHPGHKTIYCVTCEGDGSFDVKASSSTLIIK